MQQQSQSPRTPTTAMNQQQQQLQQQQQQPRAQQDLLHMAMNQPSPPNNTALSPQMAYQQAQMQKLGRLPINQQHQIVQQQQQQQQLRQQPPQQPPQQPQRAPQPSQFRFKAFIRNVPPSIQSDDLVKVSVLCGRRLWKTRILNSIRSIRFAAILPVWHSCPFQRCLR